MARSMRWRRNFEASAGTRINRSGSRQYRVPDAVQHLHAAPQGRDPLARSMDPGSAAHHAARRHSASKTRVNALMALRSVRGTPARTLSMPLENALVGIDTEAQLFSPDE